MTTESIEWIIGGKDNLSPVMKGAKASQQDFQKSLGDTADTSARTTAALALMLQTMDDSPISSLIADLGVLKGTLDSVKAAQSDNASTFEKLVANASLYFAAFNAAGSIIEFWRKSTAAVKEYQYEIQLTDKITADIMAGIQRQASSDQFEISFLAGDPEKQKRKIKEFIAREQEAADLLLQQRRNLARELDKMKTEDRRNLGFFGSPEKLEAINKRIEQNQQLLEQRNATLESYQTQLEQQERLEKKAWQDSFKVRDENNKALVKGLEDQVKALQMTQDEMILYELRQNGVRKADEERAVAAIKLRKELEEQARVEQQMAADQKQAAKEKELEQLRERNRLESEMKQIIQANLTPMERFKQEYAKLAEIKSKTGLSDDVFRRQLKKLRDNLLAETVGQDPAAASVGPLQQESSRFLANARADNTPVQVTANNTKKTADILAEAKTIFQEMNQKLGILQKNSGQSPKVFKGRG